MDIEWAQVIQTGHDQVGVCVHALFRDLFPLPLFLLSHFGAGVELEALFGQLILYFPIILQGYGYRLGKVLQFSPVRVQGLQFKEGTGIVIR